MAQKVVVAGQDITDYLFGYSSRILLKSVDARRYLSLLQNEVKTLPSNYARFGVQLSAVSPLDVGVGMRYMRLDPIGDALRKSIIQITRISDRESLHHRILFPEYYEGATGFFPQEELFKYPQDALYLVFEGKVPERDRDKLPFIDRMMFFATELQVLIECWALVHSSYLRANVKNRLSHDPYQGLWEEEFSVRHGERFHHRQVWSQLELLMYNDDLRGINRIYDTRRWDPLDLISPLLFQMQTDIIDRLWEEEGLLEFLFGEEHAGEYWRKRLKVILERYYGPSGMVHLPQKNHSVPSSRRIDPESNRARLRRIIKESHFEGERNAAIEFYKYWFGYIDFAI